MHHYFSKMDPCAHQNFFFEELEKVLAGTKRWIKPKCFLIYSTLAISNPQRHKISA